MSKKLFYYGSTASFSNLYSTQFDGVNEYISKSAETALQPSEISYSCWIKTTSAIAGLMSQLRWLGGNVRIGSVIYISSNKIVGLAASGGVQTFAQGTTSVNDGVWHHAVATITATVIKVYVDGVLEATNNSAQYANSLAYSTALTIGRDSQNNLPYYFDGKIAAPAIFNKVLTLAEVQEVMNEKMGDLRNTSVGANLVFGGYYPDGTSDYPTMTDYSGNGFNGTMTNQENTDINTDVPT